MFCASRLGSRIKEQGRSFAALLLMFAAVSLPSAAEPAAADGSNAGSPCPLGNPSPEAGFETFRVPADASKDSLKTQESKNNMLMSNIVYPGTNYPLGATCTKDGINFAIFSEHASLMVLCIFDEQGREVNRINMRWKDEGVWHCFLPNAKPGLRYGYRAHGTFDPSRGLYFNPDKLLLDPYAKAVSGTLTECDAIYGYEKHSPGSTSFRPGSTIPKTNLMSRDMRDSAPYVYKSVAVDDSFDWEGDKLLRTPLKDSVIYEVHVKGFSKQNPDVPANLRGTYAGMAHPASIAYLKKLGITAVELLPIHLPVSEGRLDNMGLGNYWGYNTLGFFCPNPSYSSSPDAVREFKEMVKALHKADIEVILDVVYNHTAEQGGDGPQLCLRGLDNINYYRLEPGNPGGYCNFTGCGNSVDTRTPRTLQLVADSLRYWVEEMHVDGFRFDLASTLARIGQNNEYSKSAGFFSVLQQDPVLSRVKLIAEPWDCVGGGYQVGGFPTGWSEWNGDWRDTVRRFWKGDNGTLGKMASKLSGSSDLYWNRTPLASINFVTAHDGFTMNDLVTYEKKLNDANGENGRDGTNDNHSWNCGAEGPTSNPEICELRERQMRNMLMTLMLSQGVPMLLGGDEVGRTQNGNNNAYCQDNPISYFDWKKSERSERLFSFVRELINIRKEHPVFRRSTFFNGQINVGSVKDVAWLNPSGKEMQGSDWDQHYSGALGMYIDGGCLEDPDSKGDALKDSSFLMLLNSGSYPVEFTLPSIKPWAQWNVKLDTYSYPKQRSIVSGHFTLPPHSSALLEEVPHGADMRF